MDDPVDDLVFSKILKKPKGSLTLFDKTAQFIVLSPPSPNSSFSSGKELLGVQGASFLRTDPIIKSIKKHDKDPAYAIKVYLDLFGLKYDSKYIKKVLEESSIIIAEQKNKFNRPRPEQLCPYFGIELDVLDSKTSNTPSYPSGHTTQARLIAEIYAEKYPSHRENLMRGAEEAGFGRVIAGFHFLSDHTVGVSLAKRLFKRLKDRKRNTSSKFTKIFDLKQKNRR